MTEQGGQGRERPAPTGAKEFQSKANEVLSALGATAGKPTSRLEWWQQIPAWALGAAVMVLAFFLVLDPPDEGTDGAWAFVIVALFLAVFLSFRSEFTFGPPPETAEPGGETADETAELAAGGSKAQPKQDDG